MTEKEFLEKRMPLWLVGDDLRITMPSNTDKMDMHSHLAKKYGYNWMYAIRGYWMPESHIQLYCGDYETPNMTIMVVQYLFNYFKDVKYIGLGCNKGEVGEIWPPKVCIPRDLNLLKNEVFNK